MAPTSTSLGVIVTNIMCAAADCGGSGGSVIGRPYPAAPGLRLCSSCCHRLRRNLTELPALYHECAPPFARASCSAPEKVSGSRTAPPPVSEKAIVVRSELTALLTSWSETVVHERRVTRPKRRSIEDLVGFLLVHLEWLMAHQAAADFADEIRQKAGTARRIAYPDPLPRLDLAKCARPGCGGALSAVHGEEGTAEQGTRLRCDAGHVWKADQWLMLVRRPREHEHTGRR